MCSFNKIPAPFEDYYEILNLSGPTCSSTDIKTAFRQQALKHHPDKNAHNILSATELTRKIIAAYEVLSDCWTRRVYDIEWEEHYNSTSNSSNSIPVFAVRTEKRPAPAPPAGYNNTRCAKSDPDPFKMQDFEFKAPWSPFAGNDFGAYKPGEKGYRCESEWKRWACEEDERKRFEGSGVQGRYYDGGDYAGEWEEAYSVRDGRFRKGKGKKSKN